MDPNATLGQQREAIQRVREINAMDIPDQSFDVYERYVIELMDAAEALDEWITKGGFLPKAWHRVEPTQAEYNGWTNRESWALALWLQNDEPLYNLARDIANGSPTAHEAEVNFKTWVTDVLYPELFRTHDGRNMLEDVGSLWRVDWPEVLAAFREEPDS